MIGLYDLIGVSWLRKRTQIPPIAEDISGNAPDQAGDAEEERRRRGFDSV